jgi:ribosome recycling factor
MELSMHKAEKEALNDERTKLQRQVLALTADKETLEDKLKSYSDKLMKLKSLSVSQGDALKSPSFGASQAP